MAHVLDETMDMERRLRDYFAEVGHALGDKRRRASFATYAMGLLGDGERKSVEPICARCCPHPLDAERAQDRVLNFLVDSTWSDRDVRRLAAGHALAAMTQHAPITTWIVDDTGFPKQGTHSVGVQRQYSGTLGKTANCQLGVSLTVATRNEHAPVDFELYLPRCWTDDVDHRKEARIPEDIPFRTKPELALAMIERAVEDGIPRGMVLCDSAYGDSSGFRAGLRALDLEFGVGVHGPTKVWRVDPLGRRRGEAISVGDLSLGLKHRRTSWRQGTSRLLWSNFAMVRVVPEHDDGTPPAEREDLWLLSERPDGEAAPSKFFFVTLPRKVTRKRLVRTVKERYRTERLYEDMKGELGLDHYEGRRFPGWHHHISAVLCCYAFVVGERARRFPPSARRQGAATAHLLAA
jgi:SRSO17 transposase